MELVLPMYNAYPHFSLKYLGKNAYTWQNTDLISGVSYLMFLDQGWLQVTETVESETTDKEELPYETDFRWHVELLSWV